MDRKIEPDERIRIHVVYSKRYIHDNVNSLNVLFWYLLCVLPKKENIRCYLYPYCRRTTNSWVEYVVWCLLCALPIKESIKRCPYPYFRKATNSCVEYFVIVLWCQKSRYFFGFSLKQSWSTCYEGYMCKIFCIKWKVLVFHEKTTAVCLCYVQ